MDVVDIDAIEFEKENIQPIRQGRSAMALSHLFSTQHEDRVQELSRRHLEFQAELEQIDELDDPLDIYARYVKWTIESYPQGAAQGNESNLVPLLERAIRQFKDDSHYRNDPRYVRLYIIYSGMIEHPMDVFKFMATNNIGVEISMYYEEHADYLESTGQRAKPLARLKRRYQEFEDRVQAHLEAKEQEQILDFQEDHYSRNSRVDPTASRNVDRHILGTRVSSTVSVHSNSLRPGQAPSGGTTSTPALQQGISSHPVNSRPNARLAVFSDQSSRSTLSTNQRSSASHSAPSTGLTPWRDLGTEQVRRKENTREASAWKGTRISAEDAYPRTTARKLEVYRDVEPDKDATSNSSEQTPPPLNDNQQTDLKSENPIAATHLVDRTLKTHPKTTSSHDSSEAPLGNRFPVLTGTSGKLERLMVDLNEIYMDGMEFSVEEIRSRQFRYSTTAKSAISTASAEQKDPSRASADSHSTNTKIRELEPRSSVIQSDPLTRAPARSESPRSPLQSPVRHQMFEPRDSSFPILPVKPVLPSSPNDTERQPMDRARLRATSPTINTKYASVEMNKIFSDRSRRSVESQWSTDDSQGVGQDELDNFTMAYAIPVPLPILPVSSRRYLEDDVQDHSDQDEDEDGSRGYSAEMERGWGSSITQDIEELRRKRAAELIDKPMENETDKDRRESIGQALQQRKRRLSWLDPGRTDEYSDMTLKIRQQKQAQQQQERGGDCARPGLSPDIESKITGIHWIYSHH
ncbi:hypothetical protein BGW38_007648 [Lunasporangiospora selenospora]|uniref:BUB1 N-terminal domain-containing protein n=1 Tax=Lunasporangiospora selenospora TaxID=979761 RepID=A0A9P6KFW8_9FUNG|nr:hypothetical protein BGW38_007648 [Lunasporangiospora selenospora]